MCTTRCDARAGRRTTTQCDTHLPLYASRTTTHNVLRSLPSFLGCVRRGSFLSYIALSGDFNCWNKRSAKLCGLCQPHPISSHSICSKCLIVRFAKRPVYLTPRTDGHSHLYGVTYAQSLLRSTIRSTTFSPPAVSLCAQGQLAILWHFWRPIRMLEKPGRV